MKRSPAPTKAEKAEAAQTIREVFWAAQAIMQECSNKNPAIPYRIAVQVTRLEKCLGGCNAWEALATLEGRVRQV